MKDNTPVGEDFEIFAEEREAEFDCRLYDLEFERTPPPADRDESAVDAALDFLRGVLSEGFKIIRTPSGFRVTNPATAGQGFDITPRAAAEVGWKRFRV